MVVITLRLSEPLDLVEVFSAFVPHNPSAVRRSSRNLGEVAEAVASNHEVLEKISKHELHIVQRAVPPGIETLLNYRKPHGMGIDNRPLMRASVRANKAMSKNELTS